MDAIRQFGDSLDCAAIAQDCGLKSFAAHPAGASAAGPPPVEAGKPVPSRSSRRNRGNFSTAVPSGFGRCRQGPDREGRVPTPRVGQALPPRAAFDAGRPGLYTGRHRL